MASTEAVPVPFFKKKRARPTTARQRTPSPPITTPSASSSKSQVVLPSRKAAGNLLSAGTKRTSSQRRSDGLDQDESDEGTRDGPGINWTSVGGHVNKALEILEGDEAEEMLAKRARKDDAEGDDDVPDDGLYHGQRSYKSHIKKSQEVPKSMRTGPVRSNNSTIRTVTIVDYQPDVCKDYRETGFCGFGDTCKFLHDRGTYLAGWQLDKLAANPQRQADEDASDAGASDDDVPFACLIGRHPFTDPIVTRCGHYFCSSCAIKRFAKTPKCAACGAPTGGIFNRADKVISKMKKMQAEEQSPGDGEENVPTGAQIEGLDESDPERSDSDQED
ncbi:hypothetical protein F5148DRAFT_111093 [Russula earlei]|uniref:Uncharacterized protein n=1 Tax=Russula earlei TaxID=71964 RepID=A0ACC0U8G6_9AGAM|nr:hypothetical protein F5148DRAFT_111093 [Russula earlei]